MNAIHAFEGGFKAAKPQGMGESHDAPTSVPAHAAFLPVGIVVAHGKVLFPTVLQDDQSIGTNSEAPLAEACYLLLLKAGSVLAAPVHHDEVVACTVVFAEMKDHGCRLKKVKRGCFRQYFYVSNCYDSKLDE